MNILKATPINVHHLRYLVATCDQGSFRKAARLLNVEGSSVSRRVRELEEYLGVRLVTRTRFGASPTIEGVKVALLAASALLSLSRMVISAEMDSNEEAEAAALRNNTPPCIVGRHVQVAAKNTNNRNIPGGT